MCLDSLPDPSVALAIGALGLADLAARAGMRYNLGAYRRISLFVDEVSNVINQPLIEILNKGAEGGIYTTCSMQTLADLAKRLGSEDAARMPPCNQRLLNPGLIPASLWLREHDLLLIPPSLATAYEDLIDECGLRELSELRDANNPPVGGLTQAEADRHFAQAFDGSAARMELALLDPKEAVTHCSDALVGSLAGGKLCLTDAPCGAGSAAFALLTAIAELGAQGVFPRQPLEVLLIGAELSDPARGYAAAILEELQASLERQAIFVEEEFLPWDVTDRLINTTLIQCATIKSNKASQKLLVVANFNAFLERQGKRKDAQPQIEELFRYASGGNSVAIWIEPDMNRATAQGGLFQWLQNLLRTAWTRFARQNFAETGAEPVPTCSARFRPPLRPSETARVGLAVMRIDLVRTDE
jgi:hypothetical protein